MIARGKREARRPWYRPIPKDMRPEGPKYSALSGLEPNFSFVTRGDALRFASRLPLALIPRAVGALISTSTRAAASGPKGEASK